MATTKNLTIAVGIKGATKLQTQLKTIKNGFKHIEKSIFSLKKSVFNLKSAFIGLAGTASLGLISKNVIKTSDEFKRYQMTLQALMGNQKKANKEWQILLKFAEQTPYTITDVMQSYKTMVAYGLNPSVQMMRALGDTGAALGKDVLPRLAYALGQVGAASKIRMQDLLQLQNAGINTGKALKESFGTADLQQLNQKVAQGVISMQQVVQAFVKYMQKHFGGTMQKQMNTLSGQFEILKSYWQEFENAIMSSGLYSFLVNQMKRINAWIEKLKKSGKFKEWANKVAETVAHLSGKILITVGKTIKAFKSIYDWVKSHKTIFEIGLFGLLLLGSRGKVLALTALAAMNSEKIKAFLTHSKNALEEYEQVTSRSFMENVQAMYNSKMGANSGLPEIPKYYHGVRVSIEKTNEHIKQNTQDTLSVIANAFITTGKQLDNFKAKLKSTKISSSLNTTDSSGSNKQPQATQPVSAVTLNQIKSEEHLQKALFRIRKKVESEEKASREKKLQATKQVEDAILQIESSPFAYFKEKLQEQVAQFKKAGVSQILLEEYKTAKLKEYLNQIHNSTNKTTTMMQQMWIEASRNMADAFGDFFVDAVSGKLKSLGDYIVDFLNTVRDAMAQALGAKVGGMVMGQLGSLFGGTVSSGLGSMSSSPVLSLGAVMASANGNILKGGFQAFASGGIVTKPTLGLVGEGRYNEAVVPLPDGRSIPVKGGAPNVEINVINKGQPVDATKGQVRFNGKKWVIDVVLNAIQTEPNFRNAIRSV